MTRNEIDRLSAHSGGDYSINKNISVEEFDRDVYLPLLEGLDVSDERADELLRVIWNIMRMFVELDVPQENWGQVLGSVTGRFGDAASGIDS